MTLVNKFYIIRLGRQILYSGRRDGSRRDFRALFGVSPTVCVDLWYLCRDSFDKKIRPRHLLWSLMWMKTCATEPILSSLVRVTRKTFRKWNWKVLPTVSAQAKHLVSHSFTHACFRIVATYFVLLPCLQIKWSNRYQGDKGRTCLVSVDGTDFRICEPAIPRGQRWIIWKGKRLSFHPKWHCHKHNGPGVRYEVAVCLQTGDIVWINGPFPCGKWPDKKIFKHKLIHKLDNNEMIEADGTYSGMPYECRMPGDYLNEANRVAKADGHARQETINRRFKQFNCLGHRYWHDLKHHSMIFKACAVCVQLSIERGEMNWDINY